MTTQTNQNHEDFNDVLASEDDFLAELEAELSADTPNIEEVGAEEVVAAEAEEPEQKVEQAKPKAKAKSKAKPKAKAKAKTKSEAADAGEEAESEVKESAGEEKEPEEKKPAIKRQSLASLTPTQALHTAMGDKMYDHCILTPKQAGMDSAARKTELDEYLATKVDTLAKKVKEKATNTFLAVAGQATLSVYTRIALQLLKDKGEFTGVDLKNRYLGRPYSPGTASAQSSQMMQLLPALQIATREGNKLVLNEDSPLFDLLINE